MSPYGWILLSKQWFLSWLLPARQSHGLDATPLTNSFIHSFIDSLTSNWRDKNKHVPDQTRHRTPKMFTDSEPPKKCRLGELTRCAPHPPNPPYGWGAKDFFSGFMTHGSFWLQKSKIFLEALDLKYNFSCSWSPYPPIPEPLDPYRGAYGGSEWGG